MELSFELNSVTPAEGGSFVMDLQYNDQDLDPATAENQSRTVVWSWSANAEFGPNGNNNLWGTVNFAAAAADDDDGNEPAEPVTPPTTGDVAVVVIVALALASLAAVVVTIRRRKVTE